MSLPVRPSPGAQLSSPKQNLSTRSKLPRERTTKSSSTKTPKKNQMSQSAESSSPLFTPPSSFLEQASKSSVAASTAQPEFESPAEPTHASSVETLQALAPDSVSTAAPKSNVDAKRGQNACNKRLRDDDSDSEDAFGTPPPKRPSKEATAAANGKRAIKKASPSQTPAPKKPMAKKTATKKAISAPPAPSSRPSRTRKAPERLEDVQEKAKLKSLPNKKGLSKVFDPVYVTTNSASRLVKADVYHMLLEGSAWTSLSAEQQSTLISMLPQDCANRALLVKIKAGETEGTRPAAFTLANNCFRTDVAKFREDLKNGHLAKTWQAAAEQAVIERAAGEYDAWKAEEAETWWGQKSQ
ncbi:Asx-hm domain containing protein [Pyrenophora tritici-repentis]|nr:Asx-hm multi-domain protein [Pyrenophora tritici-repentis]KAI0577980.1 Asx-hm multi-domain protein [Pyrenophora tritici-repentis]KAI0606347.1 Asx-hm multi-domain protein [Pyrenophora tritici-repentis]KAI0618533.1 Asx-hm multi-domain protein [Pyrenophora tritici-repentis]KAI1541871.1 Asx-hm domain containing protein [Pyrenophora tritici-repentis]